VARNFRCRLGEIDLIMLRNDTLIFVEVRSRTSSRFASAVESIDGHKQSRLVRTAAIFLRERPEFADYRVRFDVIAIDPAQRSFGKLQWIRDAFRP
jgi:putative endonuclease